MVRTRTKSIGQEMTGKQLKNSILQWAIQGKLVPQDPNDEPASVLLERIREEKKRLIKEGKIKKDKNETIIYRGEDNSYYEKVVATGEVKCIDDEIPFEIPHGWEWCRLESICTYIQRGKSPKYSLVKKYPVVAQKCNQWSGFSIDKAQFIDPDTISKYSEERILQNEDLMWNSTGLGTLGRMAIYYSHLNPYELAVADSHVTVIRLLKPWMASSFFCYYFASNTVQSVIEDKADGSTKQKELSTSTICRYLVPVPPKNEQIRIISKVEELLPVIDKYGSLQTNLDRLNASVYGALKKSILREAIQGRLVPQIPEEGTAQELLEQIRQEKARMVKEGKLKKSVLSDSIIFRDDDNKYYEQIGTEVIDITDEIPFEIPKNWIWTRLKNFCSVCTGATFKKEEVESEHCGIRVLRGGNIKPFQLCTKPDDIFIPQSKVKEDILLKHNDIVTPAVTSLENIGKMAIVELDMPHTTVGGFVFIIRPLGGGESLSKYLLAFMSSPSAIDFMKSITNKSGQAFYNIGKERLVTALVPIPPLAGQERIVFKIEKLFEQLR